MKTNTTRAFRLVQTTGKVAAALSMALCMSVYCVPTFAVAADAGDVHTASSGTLTTESVAGASSIEVAGDVTFEDLAFTATSGSAVVVKQDATITIKGTCSLQGAANGAGIQVPAGVKVKIVGAGSSPKLVAVGNAGSVTSATSGAGIGGTGLSGSNSSGTIEIDDLDGLTAYGYGNNTAGIGAGRSGDSESITIRNTHIDYIAGSDNEDVRDPIRFGKSDYEGGPAIGGGNHGGNAGNISLINCTGGNIYGGSKAAAIGAGFWGHTGAIVVTDSILTNIVGGSHSAGIGTSRERKEFDRSCSIHISGSTLEVQGGKHGAGIGSGYNQYSLTESSDTFTPGKLTVNNVHIDKSTVKATGGQGAAGIGGGYKSHGINVTITGSTVRAIGGVHVTTDKAESLNSHKNMYQAGAAGIGSGAYGSGDNFRSGTLSIDAASDVQAFSSGDQWAIDGFDNAQGGTYTSGVSAVVLQTRFERNFQNGNENSYDNQDPDLANDKDRENRFLDAHGSSSLLFGKTKVVTPSGEGFIGVNDTSNYGYYSIAATVAGEGTYRVSNTSDEVDYSNKAVAPDSEGYIAQASFLKDADYATRSRDMACEVGINSFDNMAFRDFNALVVKDYEGAYDAKGHTVAVDESASKPGTVFTYSLDGKTWVDRVEATHVTESCEVYVKASLDGYPDVVDKAKITIHPVPITITTSSATKVYDGQPLTSTDTVQAGLINGETITVTTTGSQTEVGKSDNTYDLVWGTALESDYTVTSVLGTLEVTEAPAPQPEDTETTVTIDDEETPLAPNEVTIDDGQGTGTQLGSEEASALLEDTDTGDEGGSVTAEDEDTPKAASEDEDDDETSVAQTGDSAALFGIAGTLAAALAGCAFAIGAYVRTRRQEQE